MTRDSVGICLGACSVKMVRVGDAGSGPRVISQEIRAHDHDPRDVFERMAMDVCLDNVAFGAITGGKFREVIDAPTVAEACAIEFAIRHVKSERKIASGLTLLSLGAENFVAYGVDATGSICSVETGNKCASGTGEFLTQQIRRMGLDLPTALEVAGRSEPLLVSGRCSVFCKSDCTHAINKGAPAGRVAAGLFRMVADRILELLDKVGQDECVVAVGGVTHNTVIMDMVRKSVPHLIVPENADSFEALGAALYSLDKKIPWRIGNASTRKQESAFSLLPPIKSAIDRVRFETIERTEAQEGDKIIVGLDVGSTTTKAVAIRTTDSAMLASIYLRTNGDPIGASRLCYTELSKQLTAKVHLIGIGVTGSGRRIAGLHAETGSVINEIIAHATAAAHFDPTVDTIFEIGGQDAKYTFLTNGVASDYAMNEACSAGTGSFLEESAFQSLGVACSEIEPIALSGEMPRNFSDQCSAFISSDIKTAVHEGISREDIIAGLVYSVCMNYVNRVRGRRTMGNKIFMQGGVCYNRAVPLAMANLVDRDIIVPPEPGLMGAFGVALETKARIERGECDAGSWDLDELSHRDFKRAESFVCRGGKEGCDRKCEIDMILVNGKKLPFGGACNKYENHHSTKTVAPDYDLDYVRKRHDVIFGQPVHSKVHQGSPTVGINRSFLTHLLYPLFSTFFENLGMKVVLSDHVDPHGMRRVRASFCYPAEMAHGALENLLQKKPDYLFLPAILELKVDKEGVYKKEHQCTCVLLQSEPYYLKSAFREEMANIKVLSPVLDFSRGFETQQQEFCEIARACGKSIGEAKEAFRLAVAHQNRCIASLKERGRALLKELDDDPNRFAIVLMGRPYNAFAPDANMGIPQKFASQGISIIPWDFLPFEDEECGYNMCWAMGRNLIRVSRYVAKHPRLYAAYITNFSCGPDSFLVGHFREIMGNKPSLTLELDGHTADAGVTTRVEAFLDIIRKSRALPKNPVRIAPFQGAKIVLDGKRHAMISSDGSRYALDNARVHMILPSMGELASNYYAAAFRGMGIRCTALPCYDASSLTLGRAHTSGKECLPLTLTVGGLLQYLEQRTDPDELLVYFMPTCGGNCRFTQYAVYIERLIEKMRIKNVALFSLNNENGYRGLPWSGLENLLKSILVADVLDDIRNALVVLARDKATAMQVFTHECNLLKEIIAGGGSDFWKGLEAFAQALRGVELRHSLHEAPSVQLTGEIFSRRDDYVCREILSRLASSGIVVKRAPVLEWLNYCDFNVKEGHYQADFSLSGRIEFNTKRFLVRHWERKIKRILAGSGLYEFEPVEIEKAMECAGHFFDPSFTGESQLVVGGFFKDVLHSAQGVISIGPFACMHTRVAEAVLAAESNLATKRKLDPACPGLHDSHDNERLPFLSLESDGGPLPQIAQARLEAFCLQVERIHRKLSTGHGASYSQEKKQRPARKTSLVPS